MLPVVATPCTAFESSRCANSGATNHLTPDASNLMNKMNYIGNEQIHVGDGTGLSIHHIGSSSFPSQLNSRILSLNQLLHVPSDTKNLLVSKFCSR